MALSIPPELATGGDYDGSGVEVDTETISDLILKAKTALMESGVLRKDFYTAYELLERRETLVRFTTGSKNLDAFLMDAVESQAIKEIAREFGPGKIQISYTLCLTANLDKENVERTIILIFIDTENTFGPERIHQIAEARGLEPEETMKRVFVSRINNSITWKP